MLKKIFQNRQSTQSMVAFLSISNIFNNIVTMASGLLVAKWLLPEQLGFFTGFSVLTSYIILSQLGVPSGLSRELPFYMGKGEKENAREIASVAHFYELVLGILVFCIAGLISCYFLLMHNYPYAAGTFVIGFTSFEGIYVTKYLKVLYRSNNDFNKLSLIGIITSITAALSVVFVWKLSFYGLCLRAFVVFFVNLFFTWIWRPIDVKPMWNTAIFRKLLNVGMPIYWVANIYSLWPIFQRTAVISYMGTRAMGLYALALMVENSMNIISNSLASITFPQMSFLWGQGVSIDRLLRHSTKIIIPVFGINVCIAAAAWFLIPEFVEYFLCNYTGGVKAAQWTILVGVISVFTVYSNVYMVIQRNADRLFSYIFAMAIWGLSLLILFKVKGPELEIMPQSLLLAYASMFMVNVFHFGRYSKMKLS